MCLNPLKGLPDLPEGIEVSCGKCVECEIQKSNEWASRLMLEKKSYDKACFITLTYNDDYNDQDLHIDHVQKFIKRLRKRIDPIKIKYFACGEYGSRTIRPHYHAIIFGYDFPDRRSTPKKGFYNSKELSELWNVGFHTITDVTYDSCKYVAKYMQKAFFSSFNLDAMSEHPYEQIHCSRKFIRAYYGIEPPFVLMSKKLGYDNWLKTADIRTDKIYINGYFVKTPRYFLDRYKNENDPFLVDELREKRKLRAIENVKTDEEKLAHKKSVVEKLHRKFLKES